MLVQAGNGIESNYHISVTQACTIPEINRWAYVNMLDYYLFADLVPEVNPDTFASTAELISSVRAEPFSNVLPQVAQSQLFQEGIRFGVGVGTMVDTDDNIRVAFVEPQSPAGLAGLQRSDIIVSVNEIDFASLLNDNGALTAQVGSADNPLTSVWTLIDGETQQLKTVELTSRQYDVNTVGFSSILQPRGHNGSIGYLVFNSFLETSAAELEQTIGDFAVAGISDLILDLRYNSGGRIAIAAKLASQVLGRALAGSPLYEYRYNESYPQQNFNFNVSDEPNSLGLNRLVVLTSSVTASSSEIVINALRPYIDVVTVGGATSGKPFISVARSFCGVSLNEQEAEGFNADSVSIGNGFQPDCPAADDLSQDFGLVNGRLEGMLETGVNFLVTGQCNAALAHGNSQSDADAAGASGNL